MTARITLAGLLAAQPEETPEEAPATPEYPGARKARKALAALVPAIADAVADPARVPAEALPGLWADAHADGAPTEAQPEPEPETPADYVARRLDASRRTVKRADAQFPIGTPVRTFTVYGPNRTPVATVRITGERTGTVAEHLTAAADWYRAEA
jgi:hypothetical protein